jgi:competence protein ComGF
MLLAKTEDPQTLTELDDQEIKLCSALYAVAQHTNDAMIANFLLHFLRLRVSNKRKGRQELLDVARSGQAREELRSSRLKQFFSGIRGG